MSDIAILWCGIGLGVIAATVSAFVTAAMFYGSLDKPKYIPGLRQDARKRQRLLR